MHFHMTVRQISYCSYTVKMNEQEDKIHFSTCKNQELYKAAEHRFSVIQGRNI